MHSSFEVNGTDLPAFAELTRALVSAERHIALLARLRPVNWRAEEGRLTAGWRRGACPSPEFRYASLPDFGTLRSELERARRRLPEVGVAQLYRGRIDELLLELAMVRAAGSKELPALSRRRYEVPFAQSTAERLARTWLEGTNWEPARVPTRATDDASAPDSLVSRVRRLVGQQGLPFRVEVSSSLVALAATGEDFIVVAAGEQLSPLDAERVAVHEVFGHALPRVNARAQGSGLFVAGAPGGNDLQEGFALLCEQAHGVLHPLRRAELALRHLASLAVWRGGDFVEATRELLSCGAPLATALRVTMRAFRGGGLAREGAYLPAYCAVLERQRVEPGVCDWLASGRVSLEAIQVLERSGYRLRRRQSLNSATTGT